MNNNNNKKGKERSYELCFIGGVAVAAKGNKDKNDLKKNPDPSYKGNFITITVDF